MEKNSEEVHVLAVDDSLIDRKVIERLLKISACKGEFVILFSVIYEAQILFRLDVF